MEDCSLCTNVFCSSLPPDLRQRLCSSAHRVQYKKRNEQVTFFDFRYVLILESGYVLTSRGHLSDRQQGTDILEPGDIIGVVQLFHPDYDATINLLPITPVTGCLVSLKVLESLIRSNPECAILVLEEFSKRFGRVTSKLAIHSYGSARERLDYSLQRVRELGLENEIRQEDLACLAGLSRVTVTRLLNSDKNDGIKKRKGEKGSLGYQKIDY